MEQLQYNLLYRCFVGLGVDDPVWVPTVFSKNRDRLLKAEVARKFLVRTSDPQGVRAFGRAFLGRRHAGSGVGLDEELCGEGRVEPTAVVRPQWRTRLPWREAQQRNPCLHDGARGQALQEGQRQGGEALLHWQRHDGEPQRLRGRGGAAASVWHGRARGGDGDDRASFAGRATHLRDLDRLQHVCIRHRDHDWLVRTDASKPIADLFCHAHIALPPRAKQIAPPKLAPPTKSARKRRGRPRRGATSA